MANQSNEIWGFYHLAFFQVGRELESERQAREAGEDRGRDERAAMAELLSERLSDLQAQISTQDARDRSAVEAERNRASAELANVKRALDDGEAATRAALSELERRLARSLAESTASVLINTEKLAKRHDKLTAGLEGETKQRQEEAAALRADLDASSATFAKHSNEILLEGRHAFAACEERIGNVERALREKEETDLSHLENAIDRNQVGPWIHRRT